MKKYILMVDLCYEDDKDIIKIINNINKNKCSIKIRSLKTPGSENMDCGIVGSKNNIFKIIKSLNLELDVDYINRYMYEIY